MNALITLLILGIVLELVASNTQELISNELETPFKDNQILLEQSTKTDNNNNKKESAPFWVDPVPWFLPPPSKNGILAAPLFTSFYRQPDGPAMYTNIGPLPDQQQQLMP